MKKIIIFLTMTLFLPFGNDWIGLFAQSPGSLDLSFDTDGKQITSIGSFADYCYSVALQSDGKIIVAGSSSNGANKDFALARYNSNGSLDASFDGDGKLVTDFGSSNDVGSSVIFQADGKIIVIGDTDFGSTHDIAIARYNINGSLDTTFDNDGKLTTDIGGSYDKAYAGILQITGEILVAGYTDNGTDKDFALVRYNSNGNLDTSFDGDGIQTADFGSLSDFGNSLTLQSDGKILIAGYTGPMANTDFALARFNIDGSLDNTFNGTGKLTTDFVGAFDEAQGVVVQADGKIVVVGSASFGTEPDFALARYNNNGSLDTSFDSDGRLMTDIGGFSDVAYSVALQPDSKIILAGYSSNGSNNDFSLVRYNVNGSLDITFSGDGKATTNFAGLDDEGTCMVLQQDLKIVVGGYTGTFPNADFALARYISGLNLGLIDFPKNNNSVFIYPNPIDQNTRLEYILNSHENISIYLINSTGEIVKTFVNNEKRQAGYQIETLNFFEEIAYGSYYIVISTPTEKVSVKIIK